MKKHKDLTPWLDYFGALGTFEKEGFLQVEAEKHEAYITRAALAVLALPGTSEGDDQMLTQREWQMVKHMPAVARRIRAYAGWKSRDGAGYLRRLFALHIVKEDEPHDLLYTILLTRRRAWWKLWIGKTDHVEVIGYDDK